MTFFFLFIDKSHQQLEQAKYVHIESLKQIFTRLRELAPAARGGITKPRKSLFEVLCRSW